LELNFTSNIDGAASASWRINLATSGRTVGGKLLDAGLLALTHIENFV
jgi:hypothetical protein